MFTGQALSLHENGAGLRVMGCTYDSFNYPNKLGDLGQAPANSFCDTFVQLGLANGGVTADCFYDLPVIIENNSCKGLKTSFVQFSQSNFNVKNFRALHNYIEATPGVGNTFYLFHSPSGARRIANAVINGNDVVAVNGTVVTWHPDMILGYQEAGAPGTTLVDGTYCFTLPTGTVARLPRVVRAGQSALVFGNADGGGRGIFALLPGNATLEAFGSLPAAWVATADGAALTGTTGASGKMTFGLLTSGDLCVENNTASAQTLRLTIR